MNTTLKKLTRAEFMTYCLEANVLPGIALENPSIHDALKARDRNWIKQLLRDEF